MKTYNPEDIIFSLATAWGTAAMAVIRISGKNCISVLSPHFKSSVPLYKVLSSSVIYGNLENIDKCVVTVWKDGHGYTGEEALEISCHGGLQTVKKILEFLQSLGMRQAQKGEFTLRAFIHGKMDLTRAEAVSELIDSRSDNARKASLSRLDGRLFKEICKIKNCIVDAMAVFEVQLDYAEDETESDLSFPSDEIQFSLEKLKQLLGSYKTGKLYSQGVRAVICGVVNAGKSSLFNFFLKEDRAIVSEYEGTTRDYIEADCLLDNIPIRLIDTAGLRNSTDEVEREGIKRSKSLLETADIILYLLPPDEKPDFDIINDRRCIVVASKSDLVLENNQKNNEKQYLKNSVSFSSVTGDGFDELCLRILEKIKEGITEVPEGSIIIQNSRQKECLERSCKALELVLTKKEQGFALDMLAVDLQEALEALGELTGEVTTDNILDNIFSKFCVGK